MPKLETPKDHERLAAARAVAGWETGYPGWADIFIREYFDDPAEAALRLRNRRGET